MAKDEIRILILALSLILSNGLTIFLYLKGRKNSAKENIRDKLFKLQDIVIDKPYLEDFKFVSGWVEFKDKYQSEDSIDYDDKLHLKYLQYEQYCEMIFNFASETYGVYENERTVLEQVDFKSWCRVHKVWWNNPLAEHSNHDTYDKGFCQMVDSWLK